MKSTTDKFKPLIDLLESEFSKATGTPFTYAKTSPKLEIDPTGDLVRHHIVEYRPQNTSRLSITGGRIIAAAFLQQAKHQLPRLEIFDYPPQADTGGISRLAIYLHAGGYEHTVCGTYRALEDDRIDDTYTKGIRDLLVRSINTRGMVQLDRP